MASSRFRTALHVLWLNLLMHTHPHTWLKINERIENKLLTHSCPQQSQLASQPDYLHNVISVQSTNRNHSSSAVTLAWPSVSSSLQITNRSFTYASPHLWNHLILQPHLVHSPLRSPHPAHIRGLPHHSCHLRSHHLSLPWPCTPDFSQIISFIVNLMPSGLPSWTCTELTGHWRLLVLLLFGYVC